MQVCDGDALLPGGGEETMQIGDIKNLLMPMLDDAHWAEQALDKDDNQFTRRAYIRSVFAMIEGIVWSLKQTVLQAPVSNGKIKRLSAGEYELLSDKSYDLKSNGEIREQTKHLKLPDNVRFTFKVLAEYFGIGFDLGVDTPLWGKFLAAQEIRNRITHPRTSVEFTVTDHEIEVCEQACSWFNNLVFRFVGGLATQGREPE